MNTKKHLLRRIAGGLTALATALVMLPASAMAAPEGIPPETCTVDYKTQSEGVTYDGYTEGENGELVVNYTIGENAPENIVIDLARGCLDAWTSTIRYVLPGDHVTIKINITNNSGREYAYVDNSFVLSPCDTSEVGSFEDGSLLPMLTYDGQYLPIRFTGSMLPEFFYELLGAESDGNVTFEMMCRIYDVLAEEGYTGATPISDYILDKLNTDNGTSYASLTDMYMKHSSWFSTGDGVYNNGIWNMTESELNEYIAQYPWIDDFLWVTPKASSLNVQIKWPEPELAAITYNAFYQFLSSGVYGKENAEMLNPNGNGVDFARAHGIGQYMSGTALYSETNEYFKTLFADGFVSGESVDVWCGFGLDGPLTDNKYQNYWFSWYNVIELQEVKPELPPEESSEPEEEPPVPPATPTISIRKVWVEDTDETRPDSILVEIYHDEELYDTVEVEEKYNWRASYNIPSRYEHDDWWVAEADVPAGYEDYVDETRDNVFVITNTYTVEEEESSEESSETPVEPSGPSEYIPPESSEPASEPQPAEEPAEPTLPQTGQLWWPVPALLLCGAVAVAFGAFKRRG